MFEGYTNAVEVPTVLARIGRPNGPILDHGAGTGRITSALVELGQPVIAVDYSAVSLRTLVERCAGKGTGPVLAVQADVRHLPVRDGVMAAATSVEIYEHVRGGDERRRVLEELARVLSPGGVLAISTFNFNLVYRLWKLKGNVGAREGEHLLGGDFYYYRFSHREFRDELAAVFDVDHVAGIRNIPARIPERRGAQGGGRRAGRPLPRLHGQAGSPPRLGPRAHPPLPAPGLLLAGPGGAKAGLIPAISGFAALRSGPWKPSCSRPRCSSPATTSSRSRRPRSRRRPSFPAPTTCW